jgi:hypothetical protein
MYKIPLNGVGVAYSLCFVEFVFSNMSLFNNKKTIWTTCVYWYYHLIFFHVPFNFCFMIHWYYLSNRIVTFYVLSLLICILILSKPGLIFYVLHCCFSSPDLLCNWSHCFVFVVFLMLFCVPGLCCVIVSSGLYFMCTCVIVCIRLSF